MFITISSEARRRLVIWLIGGSVLYLLSAACILMGISKVLDPIYDNPDLNTSKFACLSALNAYELMLLAVTLAILLWRNIVDDAVALIVLMATFLIGSAAALDTVGPDYPNTTLALGGAGLLLAAVKLRLWQNDVIGPLPRGSLVALTPLLLWNFLMPGVLGFAQAHHMDREALLGVWLSGWLLTLVGGSVMLTAARRVPVGNVNGGEPDQPFLHTPAMRWIVALLILAGTAVHQFAITWAFNLNVQWGDLLPAAGLICLIIIELRRAADRGFDAIATVAATTPLLLALFVIGRGAYTVDARWSFALANYPPLFMAAMGAALAILAHQRRIRRPLILAGVYALPAALLWGVAPDRLVRLNGWDLLVRFYHHPASGGWMLVALSFVILLLGAAVSLAKPMLLEMVGDSRFSRR